MFERFYYDDDSTLVDRTIAWQNPYTATGAYDCKSYLYMSSYLPFNHRYFDIATANNKTGTLSVDVWYNSAWTAVVDIVDYTHDGTQSFGQSGNIVFTIDKDKGWSTEDDSSDITELATTKVYGMYWIRFGFDSATDSACVINYIGNKFCTDTDLYVYYPLFNNSSIKTSFKSGKTTWIDQEISASNYIISDLKSRHLMISKNQILNTERFLVPCIHKTAEIIFAGMGQSYLDQKNQAAKSYYDSMNQDNFGLDFNQDGKMSRSENQVILRRMTR
jgi:hypothetical protein